MSELITGDNVADSPAAKLDMPALAELQDLLEEDFVGLLEEFITSSEQGSAELVEYIAQLKYDELRRGAHSLKGSALNVGAPSLGALWSALEDAAVQVASQTELEALLAPAQVELEQTKLTLVQHFF